MPNVPISDAQIADLQAAFGKLSADKTTADQATADATSAHVALNAATSAAAAADITETAADGQVSLDLQDLAAKVSAIIGTPITFTPAPPTPSPVA